MIRILIFDDFCLFQLDLIFKLHDRFYNIYVFVLK